MIPAAGADDRAAVQPPRTAGRAPLVSPRALWLVAAALALPLAVYMFAGTYARPTVDDMCWPPPLAQYGFWALQWESFQGSFGRWASTALISIVGYTGGALTPVLPTLLLALWVAASAWLIVRLQGDGAGGSRVPLALIVAEAIVLATMAAAPDNRQPVFWQTGSLTYVPPLVLGPVCVAALVGGRRARWVGALAFVAAGFNEPATALLFVAAAAGLAVAPVRLRRALAAALVGVAASAAIMLASPGNALRRGSFDPALWTLVRLDARATVDLLASILLSPVVWLTWGIVVVVVASVPTDAPRTPRPIAMALVVMAIAAGGVAPAIYGIGVVPPRAAFPVVGAVVWGLMLIALRTGSALRIRGAVVVRLALAGATAVSAALALASASSLVRPFGSYAVAWATQDHALRAAQHAGGVAVLPALAHNPFGLDDVGEPGSPWATECAREYYDLKSITVRRAR